MGANRGLLMQLFNDSGEDGGGCSGREVGLTMFLGILIGLFVGCVLHLVSSAAYQRILLMKGQDGSIECIGGKFFAIVPEGEYLKMKRHESRVKCLRPLACDCPECVKRFGPIHPGNVGADLRSNPTGEVKKVRTA